MLLLCREKNNMSHRRNSFYPRVPPHPPFLTCAVAHAQLCSCVGDPTYCPPPPPEDLTRNVLRPGRTMQITASWGGDDVAVEVDEECRSLAALQRALRSALPGDADVEKVCLEVGGRPMTEGDVPALQEGSVIEVVPTPRARALAVLRDECHAADARTFCEAVKAGDVRLCKLHLDAGVPCPAGHCPLHCAVRSGSAEIVTVLLDGGYSVEAKDDQGSTPLHTAAAVQNPVLCTLLLDRGGNVNAQGVCGYTPLDVAAKQSEPTTGTNAVHTILLSRGGYVNH